MFARLPLVILGGITAAAVIVLVAGAVSSEGAVPTSPTCYDWCRTPSPTPQSYAIYWGDSTCNGRIDIGDAIVVARHAIGLTTPGGSGCPGLGEEAWTGGELWGDFNCSDSIGIDDAMRIAAHLLGSFEIQNCIGIGASIQYGGA